MKYTEMYLNTTKKDEKMKMANGNKNKIYRSNKFGLMTKL